VIHFFWDRILGTYRSPAGDIHNRASAECLDLVPAKAGIIYGRRSSPKES
jgi:hypothetical protein